MIIKIMILIHINQIILIIMNNFDICKKIWVLIIKKIVKCLLLKKFLIVYLNN